MKKKLAFKEPMITPDNYILGAGNVIHTVQKEDGDWNDVLPQGERQNIRGIESYDCTGFGTLNAIEALMKQKFGVEENYSDRWVGIIAGTSAKTGGNDPHTVCEAIRKYGLIPESMLPFSDDLKDIDEYYSFKGSNITDCYKAGREWLARFEFKHEWVFQPSDPTDEKMNNIKTSLKFSPLGVAVDAWNMDNNGAYIRMGQDNHWTMIYSLDDFIRVFDSYDPFKKNLVKNYGFKYCKVFSIEKRTTPLPKENAYDFIKKSIDFLKDLVNAFIRRLGKYIND